VIVGEERQDVKSPIPECFANPAFIIAIRDYPCLTAGDDKIPKGEALHLTLSKSKEWPDIRTSGPVLETLYIISGELWYPVIHPGTISYDRIFLAEGEKGLIVDLLDSLVGISAGHHLIRNHIQESFRKDPSLPRKL